MNEIGEKYIFAMKSTGKMGQKWKKTTGKLVSMVLILLVQMAQLLPAKIFDPCAGL